MTFDFGVLASIRSVLMRSARARDLGVKQVYLSPPQNQDFPAIFLEIEEIWTSMIPMPGDVQARIKVKASCWAQTGKGRDSMAIANTLRQEVEGNRVALEDGKTGVFRCTNSITELPHPTRPSTVQHFFDVSIRSAVAA